MNTHISNLTNIHERCAAVVANISLFLAEF